MNWSTKEPRTDDGKTYLLRFAYIVCSGRYRYGLRGEPQQDVLAWRCGRLATPEAWAEM